MYLRVQRPAAYRVPAAGRRRASPNVVRLASGRGVGVFLPWWGAQLGAPGLAGLGDLSQSLVTQIGASIQQQEGWSPGSVSYQNNNPGNLIYVGQSGAVLGAGGFAKFPDYQTGLQAMYNLISYYANQGFSLNQMMAKWAPFGDGNNNPVLYAQTIASQVGIDPDTPISGAVPGVLGSSSVYTLDSVTNDLNAALAAPDLSTAAGIVGSDPVLLGAGVLVGGLLLWTLFG